jgi:hypothetical protein
MLRDEAIAIASPAFLYIFLAFYDCLPQIILRAT